MPAVPPERDRTPRCHRPRPPPHRCAGAATAARRRRGRPRPTRDGQRRGPTPPAFPHRLRTASLSPCLSPVPGAAAAAARPHRGPSHLLPPRAPRSAAPPPGPPRTGAGAGGGACPERREGRGRAATTNTGVPRPLTRVSLFRAWGAVHCGACSSALLSRGAWLSPEEGTGGLGISTFPAAERRKAPGLCRVLALYVV